MRICWNRQPGRTRILGVARSPGGHVVLCFWTYALILERDPRRLQA